MKQEDKETIRFLFDTLIECSRQTFSTVLNGEDAITKQQHDIEALKNYDWVASIILFSLDFKATFRIFYQPETAFHICKQKTKFSDDRISNDLVFSTMRELCNLIIGTFKKNSVQNLEQKLKDRVFELSIPEETMLNEDTEILSLKKNEYFSQWTCSFDEHQVLCCATLNIKDSSLISHLKSEKTAVVSLNKGGEIEFF